MCYGFGVIVGVTYQVWGMRASYIIHFYFYLLLLLYVWVLACHGMQVGSEGRCRELILFFHGGFQRSKLRHQSGLWGKYILLLYVRSCTMTPGL